VFVDDPWKLPEHGLETMRDPVFSTPFSPYSAPLFLLHRPSPPPVAPMDALTIALKDLTLLSRDCCRW
jgi:hypothetical protein